MMVESYIVTLVLESIKNDDALLTIDLIYSAIEIVSESLRVKKSQT